MGGSADVNPCVQDSSPFRQPRQSLQRRLVLWTAILVVVPMFLCAVWLNQIAAKSLRTIHGHTLELLSQTVSASLSGRLPQGWSRQAQTVIDGLCLDPRVALVMVTDTTGRVIHRRSSDAQAWVAISELASGADLASLELDHNMALSEHDELLARKTPIWNRAVRDRQIDEADASPRQLEGYVLIALRDKQMPLFLDKLALAQLGATCLIGMVMLPLVVWAVRRWLIPVRTLLRATIQLADGRKPQEVVTANDDELGMLASAFNDMAGKLVTAHQQLQQANEHLEEKVTLRTGELAQTNDKLEAEIKDKNEFLRAVSHDLGAPVRNISGMAAMLMLKYKEQLADDALTKIKRIIANAKLQTELIADLLELSRIRTQRGRKEQVDLHELLTDVIHSMDYDIERNNIDVTIEGHLPTIHAERNRMRQIFQNLLDNAVKYTLDSAQRHISIGVTQKHDAYEFHVCDTGCGISQKDIGHVFQVFTRANHSGSHHVPGRGVGLASVKSIVQAYGGDIQVQSTLGEGSRFYFTVAMDKVNTPHPDVTV
jgi:signal transduction histidine kinase